MMMPEMILFDYGQTLFDEAPFDGLRGSQAVLDHCAFEPNAVSAKDIQTLADSINREIGRVAHCVNEDLVVEVHNHAFNRFLYEYLGVRLKDEPAVVEKVFWDHAAPGKPTTGVDGLLRFLEGHGIRTGVISNMAFSGAALRQRIESGLPGHSFEFILASSEYVFRKPSRWLFELALRKAGLPPKKVWYCGDHPQRDIDSTARMGMTPVWYTGASEKKPVEPECRHHRVGHWSELEALLDKATRREEA